jgi:hypothetical protein
VMNIGVGLFYLVYVLFWKTQDISLIRLYFESNMINMPDELDDSVAMLISFEGI